MTGHLLAIARKARKRAPMEELERTRISVQEGLQGDYRGKPGRRQITILFAEDWKAAVAGLDESAPWIVRRSNLLVAGVANPKIAGGVLAIGQSACASPARRSRASGWTNSLPDFGRR
jgi:hypothetical protein